jgi:DNA repair exonuclease SbcCD ATPase subunit
MMDLAHVEHVLKQRYPDLIKVGDGVFRGIDRHADLDYAIRYFDVSDDLPSIADRLQKYQEDLLSEMYFSGQTSTDLRWNHYLYFVTSTEAANRKEFRHAKAKVESDKEYARKQVVLEKDFEDLLSPQKHKSSQQLPEDLASFWTKKLDEHGLGYVLDDSVTVPKVVQKIQNGEKQAAISLVAPNHLTAAEKDAAKYFLKDLTIQGFRLHPVEKQHKFGKVNLIAGTNGVGKTSLLEAIEYLYCGKNSRSGPLLPKTSVSAQLVGSADVLTTSHGADLARLRARNAHWYAKTDLRAVTINSSFGKFNFLDTDAASRLSVDSSREQLRDDVTRLLLGAEAEKLLDRMRRVKEQVDNGLRESESTSSMKEQLRKAADARLAILRNAPKLSDSLFTEVLTALKTARWKRLPKDKLQLEEPRHGLQAALTAIALARKTDFDVLAVSASEAEMRRNELEVLIGKLDNSIESERVARINVAEATQQFEVASRKRKVIDDFDQYITENYQEIISRHAALLQTVGTLSARLGNLEKHIVPDSSLAGYSKLLRSESAVVASRLIEQRNMLQQTLDAQNTFESTQNSLSVIRQRLISMSQELMQKGADPEHCPVCKTHFEKGELLNRMLTNDGDGAQDQLRHLSEQVAVQTDALRSTEKTANMLRRLAEFVGPDLSSTMTIGDAWVEVQKVQNNLLAAQGELATALEATTRLKKAGLTQAKLAQTLAAAGLKELPTIDQLAQQRKAASTSVSSTAATLEDIQQKHHAARRECESFVANLRLDSNASTNEVVDRLRVRLADIDAARQARTSIASIIDLDANQKLNSLAAKLEASQNVLLRLITAQAQETENSSTLVKETQNVESLSSDVKTAKLKVSRFKEASQLLEELQRNAGTNLAKNIMAENAEEIGQTFRNIHTPREFEMKVDNGNLNIIRRQSGKAIELYEMSTGQRAAYALSLFLSMNARLNTGPRVLLFDDPIAHVDDINILSFLDHLRDIAIKGTRQIFFATADNRIAGLFRHKFSFLGKNDFVDISLARDDR